MAALLLTAIGILLAASGLTASMRSSSTSRPKGVPAAALLVLVSGVVVTLWGLGYGVFEVLTG